MKSFLAVVDIGCQVLAFVGFALASIYFIAQLFSHGHGYWLHGIGWAVPAYLFRLLGKWKPV